MIIVDDNSNDGNEGGFVTKETKDGEISADAFTFLKGVNTTRKNMTTDNMENLNINNIYVGGYKSQIEKLESYQRNGINYSDHLLTASQTVEDPYNRTVMIGGEEIDKNDIVAKSAIPYPKPLRKRFLNAVETDQVMARVLDIFCIFLFEVSRKSALRPQGHYRTKNIDEFNELLNSIISPELQKRQISFCDNVDTYSQVWETFAPMTFKQALTYGTAGFFKELINTKPIQNSNLEIDIPIGTPAVLKQLNPFYFEKMYQHRKSFKPLLLEYSDQQYTLIDDDILENTEINSNIKNQFAGWKSLIIRDPNEQDYDRKNLLLPLNQMVVFRNGINVAPNLEFFGTSRIFPVLVVSEINREIHYNILPDINKIQSRGSGLITTKMRNDKKMGELVNHLEAGSNYIVSNATDLRYQQIDIKVDIHEIEVQRFNNVKHELMGLNFPSPFLNFEGTTNRDTVRLIAEFYKNTTMEAFRNAVSNDMADQWYLPLIMFFFNNIISSELEGNQKEQEKYNFINLKLKMITEFGKVDFAVFEEKLQALNNVTFMVDQEKRERVGLEPYPVNDQRVETVDTLNQQIQAIENIMRKQENNDPAVMNKEVNDVREQSKETTVKLRNVSNKK